MCDNGVGAVFDYLIYGLDQLSPDSIHPCKWSLPAITKSTVQLPKAIKQPSTIHDD